MCAFYLFIFILTDLVLYSFNGTWAYYVSVFVNVYDSLGMNIRVCIALPNLM